LHDLAVAILLFSVDASSIFRVVHSTASELQPMRLDSNRHVIKYWEGG